MPHQPQDHHLQFHHHHRNDIILPVSALFGLVLVIFGLFHASPSEILEGLWTIITHEDVLITDYVALAGIGPAFVNSGLITIISAGILYVTDETPNGFTFAIIGLMAGFSLFGKNIVNIWPIFFGTALYVLVMRESISRYINVAFLASALAPLVTFMGVKVGIGMGIIIGLIVGFILPPLSVYTFRIQNGMNLYNMGFACGLLGMLLISLLKAWGLEPQSTIVWSTGNNLRFGIALAILCLVFIGCGLLFGPRKVLSSYWNLLHTSGRAPSDYFRAFGHGPVLVNMGVNGLVATAYILLIGGDLNGATIGGILTIMGFAAYGKHAFNIIPVILGVLLGGLFNRVSITSPSLQLAALFGTCLAPISGFFGWPFGIVAGFIHSAVVLNAGQPLNGLNLYNNGFSGGLVATVLYPVFTTLFRHRLPVLQNEDILAAFEEDEPQKPSELEQHKNDDIELSH